MITNITLENFKCFRQLSINPKLITVLIGANGTGKSSVLQALLLLKQSEDPHRTVNLDGAQLSLSQDEFMNRGSEPTPQRVGLKFSGNWDVKSERAKFPIEYESQGYYYIHGTRLAESPWCPLFGYIGEDFDIPAGKLTFVGNVDNLRNFAKDQAEYDRLHSEGPEYRNYLVSIFNAPFDNLKHARFVPATRALVRRTYALGPEIVNDSSQVNGLSRQEEDTATTLAYSQAEVYRVSQWMQEVTGVGFDVRIVPPRLVKPVSFSKAGEVGLAAEGFGTNALIYLLFQLARAIPGATILIEEPEIHLHPKAQSDLAQVLTGEAKANNKQLIMATHSEHILSRLLTLVAEGKLSKDELAVYSFEKDDDGVCSATEIEVTAKGQVIGGLKGFFDTNIEEMDRYVKALQAKS